MGRLTTHVLDTASGLPAAGLTATLHSVGPDGALTALKTITTNHDGRADAPILEGDALQPGTYELRFEAGAYLRAAGHLISEPPFLDVIPIRFGIADATRHVHVPLLLSPYGYSTYRGS